MGSWAAAGVYLPHYSVAQYAALQHISFGELRPGDLVFWGSSSSPSSIYHVALYIGNNQIIQAPHTGAYVEVSGIYDWTLPNFYGRV
jgi:cell wall-associated NlpC family hydrolase